MVITNSQILQGTVEYFSPQTYVEELMELPTLA
jgi:hypothetical protein